jgi:hypothetical protein
MPRRALHWLVLCFTTLWFGVLVPVHNRGEISLPGWAPAERTAAAHRCCPADTTPLPEQGPAPCHDPARSSGGACAVCAFIATLDAPPPVTVVETRLGLAGTFEAPRPEAPTSVRVTLPFHSRAPPTA